MCVCVCVRACVCVCVCVFVYDKKLHEKHKKNKIDDIQFRESVALLSSSDQFANYLLLIAYPKFR